MRTMIAAVAFVLVTASVALAAGLHEKLNGVWVSDLMTVEIDFAKGTYSGVAMGNTFDQDLSLVKEFANVVIFKSNGNQITAQFQENGSVMLTKEGGFPAILKRAK